jgi:dTDP-4-dehydrorhamnose reductase
MKTVLITGSNGLLGQKLTDLYLQKKDKKLIATGLGSNRHPVKSGYIYETLDIRDKSNLQSLVEKYRPDCIIHTAAMTQVDDCETNQEECDKLNIDAVNNIASIAAEYNIHLVHLSTDFIFDGTKELLSEEEKPNPLSYYGHSKLKGEQIIQKICKSYAILRTVLVYGVVADMSRSNIVLWAVNSLKAGKNIKVVNDQWRTPTLAEDLAQGCFLAEDKNAFGIYNISGPDYVSMDQMVLTIADIWNLDTSLIQTISSIELNQAAKRPPKTGFNINKAIKDLQYSPNSLKNGLKIVKSQIEVNNTPK